MIDVIDGGKPAITVQMSNENILAPGQIEDLRDKMVRMFFDQLEGDSSFVGVISSNYDPGIKQLVPMNIPHVLEWIHRFFVEKKAKAPEEVGDIDDIFRTLGNYYYNEPVSAEHPGIE